MTGEREEEEEEELYADGRSDTKSNVIVTYEDLPYIAAC
jgi:hypothetical protein